MLLVVALALAGCSDGGATEAAAPTTSTTRRAPATTTTAAPPTTAEATTTTTLLAPLDPVDPCADRRDPLGLVSVITGSEVAVHVGDVDGDGHRDILFSYTLGGERRLGVEMAVHDLRYALVDRTQASTDAQLLAAAQAGLPCATDPLA